MILSTSAIVLSLLIQDPIQPKALEKLSKEVIETLIMAPSEVSNLFNVVIFNVPNTARSLRIREAVSIQRTVLNSLATLRNERAIQQALSNSLATKEEEDIKRAIELSNLTKIEEDNTMIMEISKDGIVSPRLTYKEMSTHDDGNGNTTTEAYNSTVFKQISCYTK